MSCSAGISRDGNLKSCTYELAAWTDRAGVSRGREDPQRRKIERWFDQNHICINLGLSIPKGLAIYPDSGQAEHLGCLDTSIPYLVEVPLGALRPLLALTRGRDHRWVGDLLRGQGGSQGIKDRRWTNVSGRSSDSKTSVRVGARELCKNTPKQRLPSSAAIALPMRARGVQPKAQYLLIPNAPHEAWYRSRPRHSPIHNAVISRMVWMAPDGDKG